MPIVSFICAALVLILLPLYWRTRNVAVLSAILWLAICNIARGINTAIWIDNSTIKYKVWCDISKFSFTYLVYANVPQVEGLLLAATLPSHPLYSAFVVFLPRLLPRAIHYPVHQKIAVEWSLTSSCVLCYQWS